MAKSKTSYKRKNKSNLTDWQRQYRYLYYRFLRIRGTPEAIARGLAAGVFTGLFPIFGLQIAAGVLLAVLVRGNKLMAAAGTWISNPLTSIPLFFLNYQVGRLLMGYITHDYSLNILSWQDISEINSWEDISRLGTEFITNLLIGSGLMGIICAIPSYFLGLWLARRIRSRQKTRRRFYSN